MVVTIERGDTEEVFEYFQNGQRTKAIISSNNEPTICETTRSLNFVKVDLFTWAFQIEFILCSSIDITGLYNTAIRPPSVTAWSTVQMRVHVAGWPRTIVDKSSDRRSESWREAGRFRRHNWNGMVARKSVSFDYLITPGCTYMLKNYRANGSYRD